MKFHYLIVVTFTILSCGGDNYERRYEIPNLKENIKAFINAKKCFEKSIKILTVNLKVKNDRLYVEIADTYPDINEMKFNYDTILYGHRIIFTGESIKGYSKKSSTNEFPSDIIEINKKKEWLLFEEYNSWLLSYRDGKLVYNSLGCSESR